MKLTITLVMSDSCVLWGGHCRIKAAHWNALPSLQEAELDHLFVLRPHCIYGLICTVNTRGNKPELMRMWGIRYIESTIKTRTFTIAFWKQQLHVSTLHILPRSSHLFIPGTAGLASNIWKHKSTKQSAQYIKMSSHIGSNLLNNEVYIFDICYWKQRLQLQGLFVVSMWWLCCSYVLESNF